MIVRFSVPLLLESFAIKKIASFVSSLREAYNNSFIDKCGDKELKRMDVPRML